MGNNMFAYCGNNPVMYSDPGGHARHHVEILGGNSVSFVSLGGRIKNATNHILGKLANDDEDAVLEAEYIAFYKGVPVIKVPFMGNNAFSFGIIFMGNDVNNRYDAKQIVQHEYGHAVHFRQIGMVRYSKVVAVPSVIGFLTDASDYYSQPWEYTAEVLGEVNRVTREGVAYPYSSTVVRDWVGYLIVSMLF